MSGILCVLAGAYVAPAPTDFPFSISSNQTNANLRTLALNAGWNGVSKVIATINSGVYCSSNNTGIPGLTINGSFPGGVELINNGFIIGMGGNGGVGAGYNNGNIAGSAGSSGGLALSVSSTISIANNGTIGGGGGGGGGGQGGRDDVAAYGGGGGGGGRSGTTNSSGGAGGQATGAFATTGGFGTSSAAGSGGNSVQKDYTYGIANSRTYKRGGNGGSWGAAGSSGANDGPTLNQASIGPYSGGGGGGAVSGNGNITWLATGTRLGAIS